MAWAGKIKSYSGTIAPTQSKSLFHAKTMLWLIAQNEQTKQWGYYKKELGSPAEPEESSNCALMVTAAFKKPKMPENFIYTKYSYTAVAGFVYVIRPEKRNPPKYHTNPQQEQYNWGTAELVEWTTPKGFHSKGILYKPENFDPTKKYPLIAYFYEKLSEGLYNYISLRRLRHRVYQFRFL